MAEDLTQYIKAFKGILSIAKQYSHLFDPENHVMEFATVTVAPDENFWLYLNKDKDDTFSLGARNRYGTLSRYGAVSLEELAKTAKWYNLEPSYIVSSFCNALSQPLAEHLASVESKRLENQLLYHLELNQ